MKIIKQKGYKMKDLEQNKKLIWLGRIFSVLVSLQFSMSSIMKLMGNPQVLEGMAHLGLPETLILPLGILEIICVLVYLIPITSIVGAILLTGYIGGAILAHLRVGDPVYMQIAIGILIWLGLFLRSKALRNLIPFKKG
jgi:uncharacterized membrane protein YphA (DoxX/SURF4 family)